MKDYKHHVYSYAFRVCPNELPLISDLSIIISSLLISLLIFQILEMGGELLDFQPSFTIDV